MGSGAIILYTFKKYTFVHWEKMGRAHPSVETKQFK